MRGLTTLVRLAQFEVDEQRSDLGRIVRARADAEAALGTHDAEAAREASISMADVRDFAAFSAWARHAARTRAKLQQRFAELDRTETAARESLRDAVAQMKRLQTVEDTAQAAARQIGVNRAQTRAEEREMMRLRAAAAVTH